MIDPSWTGARLLAPTPNIPAQLSVPQAGEDVPLQASEGDSLGGTRGSWTHIPQVPCNGEGPPCFLRKLLSTASAEAKSVALPAPVLCSTSWRAKNTLALPRSPGGPAAEAVISHLAQLKGELQSLFQSRMSRLPFPCPLGPQDSPFCFLLSLLRGLPCTPAAPLLPSSFLPLNPLHPRADDWALTRVRTAALLQNTPAASRSSSKAVISTQVSDGNPLVGESPGASIQELGLDICLASVRLHLLRTSGLFENLMRGPASE